MKYILFAVHEPDDDTSIEHGNWRNFQYHINKAQEKLGNFHKIGPNAVLIDRGLGMPAYNALVAEAEKNHLIHRTVFLESETEWNW